MNRHINALGASVASLANPFESVDPGAFDPLNLPTSRNPDAQHILPQNDNPDNPQSATVAITDGQVSDPGTNGSGSGAAAEPQQAKAGTNPLLILGLIAVAYILFFKK